MAVLTMLPSAFVENMKKILGSEAGPFLEALDDECITSARINRRKIIDIPFTGATTGIPWCSTGYYLPQRPVFTLDPLFHSGVYYVQEASSMFLEQILCQTTDLSKPLKVLDLCAAPGGKSTHIASLLSDESLLVSNEVIRPRAKTLAENMIKWGVPNVIVTNNDPADFKRLQGMFDIIFIDAPCSGEGMFRKAPESINEWSPDNVAICASRQRRIIADVWDSLSPDGILVFSTCTYNRMENEDNTAWIIEQFGASPIEIDISKFEGITPATNGAGYHFYPHKTKGEGFFIAPFRKNDGSKPNYGKNKKTLLSKAHSSISKELSGWLLDFRKFGYWEFAEKVLAFPEVLTPELFAIVDKLTVITAGTTLCEIKAKNLVPTHNLSISNILNRTAFATEELELQQALQFLKKEDVRPLSESQYVIPTYKNIPLGFLKKAGNRYNNMFPKEWRIKMDVER